MNARGALGQTVPKLFVLLEALQGGVLAAAGLHAILPGRGAAFELRWSARPGDLELGVVILVNAWLAAGQASGPFCILLVAGQLLVLAAAGGVAVGALRATLCVGVFRLLLQAAVLHVLCFLPLRRRQHGQNEQEPWQNNQRAPGHCGCGGENGTNSCVGGGCR